MATQNPDGTWSYSGSTVKYASEGAANYYGPRDAGYVSIGYDPTQPANTQEPTVAGTTIKTGSPEAFAFYGLDPKTGTISQEKREKLKTGYLPEQLLNLPPQDISKKKRHEISDEEARERGINRIFGGKDYREQRKAERKARNRQARIEAGPAKPYAVLGVSTRENPYAYDNPNFPYLPEEVAAREAVQQQNTLMEVGYGGQQNYTPTGQKILQERRARREATALKMAYQKEFGNINPQISEAAYKPLHDYGTTEITPSPYLKPGDKLPGLSGYALHESNQIIQQAKQEGATKIEIYEGNEPIGAINVEGGQDVLYSLLKSGGELRYRFANPEKYKEEHKAIKEQNKEFKEYINKYNKLGSGQFDIYQGENFAGRTTAEHPLYDYYKASHKYGEVSLRPTKTIFGTNKPQPQHEAGSPGDLASKFVAPFYNTGVETYYAFNALGKNTQSNYKAKEEELSLYTLEDPFAETITTGKAPKGLTREQFEASAAGNIAFFGLAFLGGKGLAKSPEPTIKAKALETAPPTGKAFYRPTNMYRARLSEDIFRYDTAEAKNIANPPIKSKSINKQTPRSQYVEQGKIKRENEVYSSKGKLLGKYGNYPQAKGALQRTITKPKEQIPPEDLNPLGRRGKPPIKRNTVNNEVSRSQYVEQGRIKPEHQLYDAKGKLVGTYGTKPAPKGALQQTESRSNQLVQEDKNYKPNLRQYADKLNPDRSVKKLNTDEILGIKTEKTGGIEYTRRGRKPKEEGPVKEDVNYKPSKRIKGNIFAEDTGDQPAIGEPESFKKSLKKNPLVEEKAEPLETTSIKTKDVSRRRPFSTQDYFKPKKSETGLDFGKQVRTKSGQILIQKTKQIGKPKLQTKQKAITASLTQQTTERRKTKPLIKASYIVVEETEYLHKNRPQLVPERQKGRTATSLFQSEKIAPRFGLSTRIGTVSLERPKVIQKERLEFQTKQSEKQQLTPKLKTQQVTKQSLKLVQRQRERFAMPSPLINPLKTSLTQPLRQQQKQKTTQIFPPTTKPPRTLTGFLPPKNPVSRRPKPSLGKHRRPFIGAVPITEIEGVYKREDIIYGQKRVSKLSKKDILRSKKGYFATSNKHPTKKGSKYFTQDKSKLKPQKLRKFRL